MEQWPATDVAVREAYGTFATRYGEWKAAIEMSVVYGVGAETVRKRLRQAGVRTRTRRRASKPSPDELREIYAQLVAEHGQRQSIGQLAKRYDVVYITARQWLLDAGLHEVTPQTPRRPITTPCPCGAKATTRYKDQDPPLCFRCYMRTYASDSNPGYHRTCREYVADIKKDAVCADCGGKFPPCVLDFDHVPERGPKLFNIGTSDVSIKRLEAEIAKCDIVCANCHRIRTWLSRGKSLDEAV
jgi:hypothetical protein